MATRASSSGKTGGSPSTEDPRRDPYEPDENEKTAVQHWLGRVDRAETDCEDWWKKLDTWRGYVAGTKHNDESGTEYTRVNLIFATIATIVPQVYAKNPEVAVTPSKGCPRERLELVKKFCRTASQFLEETVIDEAKLKKRMKANLRSAMTTSFGCVKMTVQEGYRGDPVTVHRIEDAQDNLSRVEALILDMQKTSDPKELALKRDEVRANLESLRSQDGIKIYKGFVVDRVRSENFLVLDPAVAEFDEVEDAEALGDKVYMRVSEFRARFGFYPEKATKYASPFADDKTKSGTPKPVSGTTDGRNEDEMYVCVIEIWDKRAGVIRTVAKGMDRWVRPHRTPSYSSQRWYPYFVLGLNIVEGRWRPLSEPELLMGLQDEYNTTRTNFADHRADSVPRRYYRLGGNLTDEDIERITKSKNRDFIGIKGNPATPIGQDVLTEPTRPIDPLAYDVTQIRNDIDLVEGLADTGRANLIKPKTATEAELLAQGMSSRNDERRDTNEDLMSDLFSAALEQGLRCFSKKEIAEMCGEDATWPEMSVDEIFSLVDVKVRAGSSGKPNQAQEKEQWVQLLPIIEKTMLAVNEARATGNTDMANTATALLRETIHRFEERIDVDSLIPPIEAGSPEEQMNVMRQQVQELQAQLAAGQEQLQGLTQERDKAVAGEQERVAKAQAAAEDQARKDAMAEAQAERDAQKEARAADAAERAAAREDEIARYRIDQEGKTKKELATINARATDAEMAEKEGNAMHRERLDATMAALAQAMQDLAGLITDLTQKLDEHATNVAEFIDAERELVLDDEGMPVGVNLKRKPRQAAQAH